MLTDTVAVSNKLTHFYFRRVKRLYPALLVMILICLMIGYLLLLPEHYKSLAASSSFSVVGLSNWYFLFNTGYFEQAAESQPLLHTWSLGVEEQFYLVWPLLMLGLLRRSPKLLGAACLITVFVSFGYNIYMTAWSQQFAFYGPLGRGWELALGALLVFVKPRNLAPIWDFGLTALAIIIVIASAFVISNTNAFPGWLVLAPCLATAILIWPSITPATSAMSTARVLGAAPLRYVGLVSYSWYLWHWPILVFYHHYNGFAPLTVVEGTVILLASLGIAYLSWRWVEQPFRRVQVDPRQYLLYVLAFALGVLGLAGAIQSSQGAHQRMPADEELRQPPKLWQWQPAYQQPNVPLPNVRTFAQTKTFGADWSSADYRIVLWGDSHALHIAPYMEAALLLNGRIDKVSVTLFYTCPAFVDGEAVPFRGRDAQHNARCSRGHEDVMAFIRAQQGEVQGVVLASAWAGTLSWLDPSNINQSKKMFEDALTNTMGELQRLVPHVGIIGQVPYWQTRPVDCMRAQKMNLYRSRCDQGGLTLGQSLSSDRVIFTNAQLDRLAQWMPAVNTLLPTKTLCKDSECLYQVDGKLIHMDSTHLRHDLPMSSKKQVAKVMQLDDFVDKMVGSN